MKPLVSMEGGKVLISRIPSWQGRVSKFLLPFNAVRPISLFRHPPLERLSFCRSDFNWKIPIYLPNDCTHAKFQELSMSSMFLFHCNGPFIANIFWMFTRPAASKTLPKSVKSFFNFNFLEIVGELLENWLTIELSSTETRSTKKIKHVQQNIHIFRALYDFPYTSHKTWFSVRKTKCSVHKICFEQAKISNPFNFFGNIEKLLLKQLF